MQIIGADHRLIYNGTNGFVVVFHPANNGEFDVKCYYNRSIFDNQRIIDMLRMANSCPEGSHYDVVYSAIDQINFTEGSLLQIEPYAIVLVAVFSTSGRYTFYTNLTGDSVRRSETFADMMKHLYYSILKTLPPDPHSAWSGGQNDEEEEDGYDEENCEDDGNDFLPSCPDPAQIIGIGPYVGILYSNNLLFNLFGDQMLAVVCASESEYNDFIKLLRELLVITTRSLMPSEWNGVSRYIMFDITRNTAFAVYNLPETVETIVSYQHFLEDIAKDAEGRLGEVLSNAEKAQIVNQ